MSKLLKSARHSLRSRSKWLFLIAAALLYGLPMFVFKGFSASDYLLEIDGIKGESTDEKHKDWIEIDSFSFGMSRSAALPGGAGQAKLTDVFVRKRIDKSSPLLMLRCCTGEHIPEALLSYNKPTAKGPVEYLKIKMSEILVTSYAMNNGSDSLPVDQISLNFTKITMTYIPYDATGNPGAPVEATCDFSQTP